MSTPSTGARWALGLSLLTTLLVVLASALLWLPAASAAEAGPGLAAGLDPAVRKWGYLAAGLATGLSSLAAGYAVATVGSAAIGALAEKPELFGRTLILTGLAEGIAIYGLIVSILILNQLAGA